MSNYIYEDKLIYIEKENSEIPWVKIFTKVDYKELSDMPKDLRLYIWEVSNIIELEMINYYNPTKINLASFANILPRVHIHIMARFKNDSYYPNPMWGEKLRNSKLELPDETTFFKNINYQIKEKLC
jgi:diadenosine tetraphosphate (Ap4A) HIT family hydrolase